LNKTGVKPGLITVAFQFLDGEDTSWYLRTTKGDNEWNGNYARLSSLVKAWSVQLVDDRCLLRKGKGLLGVNIAA
jgi:hypothetical protein